MDCPLKYVYDTKKLTQNKANKHTKILPQIYSICKSTEKKPVYAVYSALPLPEFTYEVPRYFHTGTWKRVYSISDVGERGKKGVLSSILLWFRYSFLLLRLLPFCIIAWYDMFVLRKFLYQYVCVVNNYAITVSAYTSITQTYYIYLMTPTPLLVSEYRIICIICTM